MRRLQCPVMSQESADNSDESAGEEPGPLTPAMRQYRQFKTQYPDYILFFRMGDFYEMCWEDARTAARVLGVALTSRSRGGLDAPDAIAMAGVPFHAVDGYLRRMIAAGFRVAVCEQTEDPASAKGLIKREVVRLITPGTLTDEPLLEGRSDNYLAAVALNLTRTQGYRAGLVWVELSTGGCWAMNGSTEQVLDTLVRLRPAEVLVPEQPSGQEHDIAQEIRKRGLAAITPRAAWQFASHFALEQVQAQWGATTAGGYGFEEDDPAVLALGATLSYLRETQKSGLDHLRPPRRHVSEAHMGIDPASWRSLEIERTVRSGGVEGSLLWAIDHTRSGMGARLLRQWLRFPLLDLKLIAQRQETVAALLDRLNVLQAMAGQLREVCDIERILGRVAVGRAAPRDLAALGKCLREALPSLLGMAAELEDHCQLLAGLGAMREFCAQQGAYLTGAVQSDPPGHLRDGGVIADGFDPQLDELRRHGNSAQQWLVDFQKRMAQQSGIASLKVAYNKVFGYYLEVTGAHRDKVPMEWTRRQTVKNAERYVTAELKEFENTTLGARDRAIALEQILFEKVRQELLPNMARFQQLAESVAQLDVLAGLAELARQRRYCRPEFSERRVLEIEEGRHPVLEKQLGAEFVANDVKFAAEDTLQLITGPNMAGKSTYIRQVALIVLLGQIGSFVPARQATLGVVDRLFTRIGASDELHSGQSTFMVEMTETANILNNATERSLVILDEIGRGTSTLDGLSLAWALAEHIAVTIGCRTLFATHYHELTELARRFKGVSNLNVAVREWEDQVIFLHRIVPGGTDRSYGIHVARLAGLPGQVLQRARQLLSELSVHHVQWNKAARSVRSSERHQLQLFEDPAQGLARALGELSLDTLTPLQAFEFIKEWKKKVGNAAG